MNAPEDKSPWCISRLCHNPIFDSKTENLGSKAILGNVEKQTFIGSRDDTIISAPDTISQTDIHLLGSTGLEALAFDVAVICEVAECTIPNLTSQIAGHNQNSSIYIKQDVTVKWGRERSANKILHEDCNWVSIKPNSPTYGTLIKRWRSFAEKELSGEGVNDTKAALIGLEFHFVPCIVNIKFWSNCSMLLYTKCKKHAHQFSKIRKLYFIIQFPNWWSWIAYLDISFWEFDFFRKRCPLSVDAQNLKATQAGLEVSYLLIKDKKSRLGSLGGTQV